MFQVKQLMLEADESAGTWSDFAVPLKRRVGGGRVDPWDCSSSDAVICRQVELAAGRQSLPLFPGFIRPWVVQDTLNWLNVFTLVTWWSVEKMQAVVLPRVVLPAWYASKAPTFPKLVRYGEGPMYLCLKRPSFYCLIHFYKRCVSSLALMGRSPWVRSGWVSVLSVTTFFIQG